ncbi:MAG TPA: hypothetical protein VM492_13650 [Sumerlaeia bacterium]|nr:hypothetical protein [Sumerlaeia bacterium]
MDETSAGKTAEARIVWALGEPPTPARRIGSELFEKELIRVGTWKHPSGDFILSVDNARLARWAAAFREMKRAGVKVPLPYGHSYDARDNAGFVEDVWILDDGRLMGLIRAPREEDAARLGTTAMEVSVSITPDYIDGEGKHYGEAIEHVAITNYPVIPAQENFRKIAADATGGRVEIVTLEKEEEEMGKEKEAQPPAEEQSGKETKDLARDWKEATQLAQEKQALADENKGLKAQLAAAREKEIDAEIDALLQAGKVIASDDNKADIKALLSAEGAGAGVIHLSRKGADGKETAVAESPAAVFRRVLSTIPDGAVVNLAHLTRAARGRPESREEEAKGEAKKNLAAAGIKPRE